jgi:SPASM domain peptide maturase of grasp-with-spasm system
MNGKVKNEWEILFDGNKNMIEEYISFLKEKDAIFLSNIQIPYRKIDLHFDYPAQISNTIHLFHTSHDLKNIYCQLAGLNCEHIQLFFDEHIDFENIKEILKIFDDSKNQSIEIILLFQSMYLEVKQWENLFEQFKRLQLVLIQDSPKTERIPMDILNVNFIFFTMDKLSYQDCGEIHPLRFQNNLTLLTESQKYNTCLNRKLCIDSEGNIKNCPSMQQKFGNIQTITLKEVIETSEFKNLWYINKEQIDVCKDCEFRHMCIDCRCFIKDPDNIYSQPAKCIYNPYICKWQGQEGYVPVEECGTYTRETGFVPDKEKINKLNKQIWGEDE